MPLNALEPRRAHPRAHAGFPVHLQIAGRSVTVHARDISMTGALLDMPFEPPDRVPLRFRLPGVEGEANATGRVERRDDGTVAISFSTIEWEDLLRIARYLANRL